MATRSFLNAKLHRIRTTGCHLDYVGSVSICRVIMAEAGIDELEQVDVVNLSNGERWTTYAIPDDRPGTFQMNGGGARLAVVGDRCVVMTYAQLDLDEVAAPRVVHFDDADVHNLHWSRADEQLGLRS
jgi:aspartate 1-decarboxylase